MTRKTEETEIALVKNAIAQLAEHFDNVYVFVSKMSEEDRCDTISIDDGAGNCHALFGQIHDWCVKHREITKREALEEYDEI